MFTIDDKVLKQLGGKGFFRWPKNRLTVYSLYLFPQKEIILDTLTSLDFDGLPDFKGLDPWKEEDKKKIEEMVSCNPEKYIPLIKQNDTKRSAKGMYYQMNERNGDMRSPNNIEYAVTAESLQNFNGVKALINPAVILVNIYVELDYNSEIRESVKDFAKQKSIPLVLYAPEGRDQRVANIFEQIKNEWNAKCGFVAGDAQWDGVLSVAESMFGFMGLPARDWLYDGVVRPGLKELNKSQKTIGDIKLVPYN